MTTWGREEHSPTLAHWLPSLSTNLDHHKSPLAPRCGACSYLATCMQQWQCAQLLYMQAGLPTYRGKLCQCLRLLYTEQPSLRNEIPLCIRCIHSSARKRFLMRASLALWASIAAHPCMVAIVKVGECVLCPRMRVTVFVSLSVLDAFCFAALQFCTPATTNHLWIESRAGIKRYAYCTL